MATTRLILYVLGTALVIVGVVLLFFRSGLDAWVPSGIALAGLIVVIGVAVMGLADRAREPVHEERVIVEEHEVHRRRER